MNWDVTIKVLEQTFMLAFLGCIGYWAGKTGYLPKETGKILSSVVVKITAPCMIFTSLAGYAFSEKVVSDGIQLFVFGVLFVLIAFCLSQLHVKFFHLPSDTKNVYQMHAMFGNIIFLSFPLLFILFGEKGVVYAAFFNMGSDSLLWTLGMFLLHRNRRKEKIHIFPLLVNVNSLAFVFGLVVMILRKMFAFEITQVPGLIDASQSIFNTLAPLGKTTIYLSMLFIGLILSEVHWKDFVKEKRLAPILFLSSIKLTMMPLIAWAILFILQDIVDPYIRNIVLIQLSMPAATIVPALCAQYHSDYLFATKTVMVSTILFFVTFPLVLLVLL